MYGNIVTYILNLTMKNFIKHIFKTIIYPYRRILIALGLFVLIGGNIVFYFIYLQPQPVTPTEVIPSLNTYTETIPFNSKPISLTLSNSYGQVDLSSLNQTTDTNITFNTIESRPVVLEETSTDIKLLSLERSGIDINSQYYKNSSINLSPLQSYKEFIFSLQYSKGNFDFSAIPSLENLFLKVQQASATIVLPKTPLKTSQLWKIENNNGDITINIAPNTPVKMTIQNTNTIQQIPNWLIRDESGSYVSTALQENLNQPFITLNLSGNNNLYTLNAQ